MPENNKKDESLPSETNGKDLISAMADIIGKVAAGTAQPADINALKFALSGGLSALSIYMAKIQQKSMKLKLSYGRSPRCLSH